MKILNADKDWHFIHFRTAIWPHVSTGIFKADMPLDPSLPLLGAILISQLPLIEWQLCANPWPWCSAQVTADGHSMMACVGGVSG